MKKSILRISIYVVIAAALLVLLLSSCTNTNHKYAVEYNHGKWSYQDFTDTFQLSNGSVKYTDESGAEIIRYGTFSIQKNKDFQK
jgi:hypothetical protein